jgi:hypothetical protein
MEKNPEPGSGIRDEHSDLIFRLKILKFFDADPESGILPILDPERKKIESGIQDKHPGSATLHLLISTGIEEVDGQQRTQSILGMAQILGPIAEYSACLVPYLVATC